MLWAVTTTVNKQFLVFLLVVALVDNTNNYSALTSRVASFKVRITTQVFGKRMDVCKAGACNCASFLVCHGTESVIVGQRRGSVIFI